MGLSVTSRTYSSVINKVRYEVRSQLLRKETITFLMSVRPHGTIRPPLDGFELNLVLDYFSKIYREIHIEITNKMHECSKIYYSMFNPLNPELNPICYLLALLGAHHFLQVNRIRVKSLTLRLLMSYIYGAPILDVSRSHTT